MKSLHEEEQEHDREEQHQDHEADEDEEELSTTKRSNGEPPCDQKIETMDTKPRSLISQGIGPDGRHRKLASRPM